MTFITYNPIMSFFPVLMWIFWLSLSTWFGCVLFVAIAAPIIFRVTREYKPTLPLVLSVNLENQHADLLGAMIVSALMSVLIRIELCCAVGVFIGIAGQWLLTDSRASGVVLAMVLRSCLLVAAGTMAIYKWRVLWPRINMNLKQYLDHADEPDIANPAKDRFEKDDRENVNVLMITLVMLLGLVLYSSNVTSAREYSLPIQGSKTASPTK